MRTESVTLADVARHSPSDGDGRKPSIVIEPRTGLFSLDLKEIWEYRELLYFLVWREVKVRYKQTAIGAAWAIIQPVMTMVIFTVVFDKLAGVPSDGLPYPLFAFSALLPWNYFSQAITQSSMSVVGDANLIRKVYFPRVLLPLAAATAPIVDFLVALLVLFGMFLWYEIRPGWGVLAIPVFLVVTLITALAVGLWFSALNVRYRDVRYTVPFILQIWMYASPIAYPMSLVPGRWKWLYSLNPLVAVIEGCRWALLGKARPDLGLMGLSLGLMVLLLSAGLVYFGRTQCRFADVI